MHINKIAFFLLILSIGLFYLSCKDRPSYSNEPKDNIGGGVKNNNLIDSYSDSLFDERFNREIATQNANTKSLRDSVYPEVVFNEPSIKSINIKDLGAMGDGVNDDSDIFLQALKKARDSKMPLYVPEGNYLINKEIAFEGGDFILYFSDSAILFTNSKIPNLLKLSNADKLTISGGTFSAKNLTSGLILIRNIKNVNLKKISLIGKSDNIKYGIRVTESRFTSIIDCKSKDVTEGSTGSVFSLTASESVEIIDCFVENAYTAYNSFLNRKTKISGNTAVNCSDNGVYNQQENNVGIIEGNYFKNCVEGIVTTSPNTQILNNTIDNSSNTAINYRKSHNIIVKNNTFNNNYTDIRGAKDVNHLKIEIVDNKIYKTHGNVSIQILNGINCLIERNEILTKNGKNVIFLAQQNFFFLKIL